MEVKVSTKALKTIRKVCSSFPSLSLPPPLPPPPLSLSSHSISLTPLPFLPPSYLPALATTPQLTHRLTIHHPVRRHRPLPPPNPLLPPRLRRHPSPHPRAHRHPNELSHRLPYRETRHGRPQNIISRLAERREEELEGLGLEFEGGEVGW